MNECALFTYGHYLDLVSCRPCSLFLNHLLYDSICAEDAIKLDANHIVVIYKRLPNGNVERRLVEGPAVVVPEAAEWSVMSTASI